MQPLAHFAGISQCLIRRGIHCHLVHVSALILVCMPGVLFCCTFFG
uniref:Uncharacterized protein n=1 Tax=Triticum urartu TaxID=4572 RepID=A0A8R7TH74_TRIUA